MQAEYLVVCPGLLQTKLVLVPEQVGAVVVVQAPVQVLAIPHEEAAAVVALVQGRLPTQVVGLLRFLLIDMPLPCLFQ
jgi:hypothetical protein